MLKALAILVFFALFAAAMKPVPSVKQLTEITKISCKDICK